MNLFRGQRSRSPGQLMLKTESVSYLSSGKAYEVRTSNLVHRWSTKTRTTDKRHELQGQRSRSRCHVMRLAHKSRTKSPIGLNTKIGRSLPTPRAIMRTSFKVKRQINARVADAMWLMLELYAAPAAPPPPVFFATPPPPTKMRRRAAAAAAAAFGAGAPPLRSPIRYRSVEKIYTLHTISDT